MITIFCISLLQVITPQTLQQFLNDRINIAAVTIHATWGKIRIKLFIHSNETLPVIMCEKVPVYQRNQSLCTHMPGLEKGRGDGERGERERETSGLGVCILEKMPARNLI
jgi:hypothetical protein